MPRIARPSGDHESMVQYDRQRMLKEMLLDRIISTCVDTADAVRFVLAALAVQTAPVTPEPAWSIATLTVATGATTLIVPDGEQPVFRPDGQSIAFVRAGKILAVSLDTGEVRTLTDGPGDGHPTWE